MLENDLVEVVAAAGCPLAAEQPLAAYAESLEADSPWLEDITATLSELSTRSGQDSLACAGLLNPG